MLFEKNDYLNIFVHKVLFLNRTCEQLGKFGHKLHWLDISSCQQITNNSLKALRLVPQI